MIGFKVLFLLLITLCSTLCESKRSLVPQAILQLVKSHYGEDSVKIEVIYNSDRIKVLPEILKLLSGVKELKVTKVEANDKYYNEDDYNDDDNYNQDKKIGWLHPSDAICIFDTMENFFKFENSGFWIYKNRGGNEFRQLIYCEDLTSASQLNDYKGLYIFPNFIVEENSEISLNAFTWFTEQKCDERQQVELNRFSSLDRKWTTKKFFNQLIQNFHGCKIVIAFRMDCLPFSTFKFSEDGSTVLGAEGVLVELVKALSTHLNFTISYRSVAGLQKLFWTVEAVVVDDIVESDAIYTETHVIIVPPGKFYTPWEKLFLPFDRDTWIWLGIVFTIAILVILLIKLSNSGSMYDFVIGSNVPTPILNVIAIFMGISQIFLPQRNVSRFLFINFILFCLIMRTAYQGKYFEFLTCDIKKKPIATVDELKENNFTIHHEFGRYSFHFDPKTFDLFEG